MYSTIKDAIALEVEFCILYSTHKLMQMLQMFASSDQTFPLNNLQNTKTAMVSALVIGPSVLWKLVPITSLPPFCLATQAHDQLR